MAQWLGFQAVTAVAWVQSLVGELKPHKLQGAAPKKKENSKVLLYSTENYIQCSVINHNGKEYFLLLLFFFFFFSFFFFFGERIF